MTQFNRIGLDTSKAVFTLHCVDEAGKPLLRINLRRAQLLPFFKKHTTTVVAMEACGGSHHWARKLLALGHEVRLIPAQYVKPYLKRGKNDRNDAEAICEAAGRPGMRFVLAKTEDQQAQAMVMKVRTTLIDQRTQLINALRGHAAEFGVIAAKGISKIPPLLTAIAAETTIPAIAREMMALLGQQIDHLNNQIATLEARFAAMHQANALSQMLATAPGIGPIIALTFAIEVDVSAFETGRHLAAWLGLTPREHSTGGKQRMGGISRAGNERLRSLLVEGAMSVIRAVETRGSKLATPWLLAMLARRPKKVVAVALANKMARMIWAMMTRREAYRRPAAAGAVCRPAVVS
jgi:transposase